MPRKSRRQRRLNLPAEAYRSPVARARSAAEAPAMPVAPTRETARATPQVNWQAEYGEVLGDLKRTAILAAGLMAAMIVLSFIIH